MIINFRVLLAQKEQREKRNIGLRSVARECSIPMYTVSALYSGEPKALNPKHLDKLCSYFDCDIGELLIPEKTEIIREPATPRKKKTD